MTGVDGKQYRFSISLTGTVDAKDEDEAKTWFERAKKDAIDGIIEGSGAVNVGNILVLISGIKERAESPDDDDGDDNDDDDEDDDEE